MSLFIFFCAFGTIDDRAESLIDAINDRNTVATKEAAEAFVQFSTEYISDDRTLVSILRDPMWQQMKPNRSIAVIDSDERLVGLTSRELLLSAATESIAQR